MKHPLLKILFCSVLIISFGQFTYAQSDNKIDTLILDSNTPLIGQIDNLYPIITLDGNIIKRELNIDTSWGKHINIPVRDVKYVKAFGTTFEHVELNTGAHQLMEVIVTGKMTLYLWRKISLAPGANIVTDFNETKKFKPATGIISDTEGETYMILANGKWYDATTPFIKKKFAELFGDCPKLVQEAKSKDFNYKAIGKIVKEYNGCF